MKVIVFKTAGNDAEQTLAPNYRKRLVKALDGMEIEAPLPLDSLSRKLATDDPRIEYAETEEEFLSRVALKSLPSGATVTGSREVE